MPQPSAQEARTHVLVIDDEGDIRQSLELLLKYEGYDVWTARDGQEGLARLDREEAQGRRPGVILCDVKMPRMTGLEFMAALERRASRPPLIMISGHSELSVAVDAVKRGAADFLEKPLDTSRLLVSIDNALRVRRLASENRALRRQLGLRWQLVGESPQIVALREQIARVAVSEASVLISGENGTGKEVVARGVHLASSRAAGPFVAVNCAAIPAELIESELFGHEKGSFTGALERRVGHFESAEGGTLFLDEVGDMPLAAQAKVLRALESREITRVGGNQPCAVDLRVVAATNADLALSIEAKTFRMDFYYRLNVVPLRVPPLRERVEDIPLLAGHFLAELADRQGRAPHPLTPEALEFLKGLEYPGNVRQLRNLIEGGSAMAAGDGITRADLEAIVGNGAGRFVPALPAGSGDPFQAATFEEFKDKSEALFIQLRLAKNGGNVKRTAEELGMQRSHLYKKLDRYGLR
ncbi:MAG: sigma-54-dependent Fis family transcriptional regulator [Planctomycetes bacterium]|nr:sigma-54-dependent Fis family transcriptional regulator [Planctomycetota bacterium]